MSDDERIWPVKKLLFDYVEKHSLRYIRDAYALTRLAEDIVKSIEGNKSIWRKWTEPREHLLKSALCCWVPTDDMHAFLNAMPGPQLTATDVTQRQRAFEEEPYGDYPNEAFQAGCMAIYEREKAEGTELPAIIHLLRDYVEKEEDRHRTEQQEEYRRWREQDRTAREQRLLSGADCGWTQLPKSPHWYCRMNGRTYRASPSKDRMWDLYRVNAVSDDEVGNLLGTYRGRGDATKAIKEMAYKPEPRR